MVHIRPRRLTRARTALAGAACLAVVVAGLNAASPATAADPTPRPLPGADIPSVPGLGTVDTPDATTAPAPLPKKSGTVTVRTGQRISTSGARTTATTGIATLATATDQVAVRALVLGVDASDFGVPTWKAMLDRTGAAYDVVYAASTPLTTDSLVGADGVGRYNAILLTNSMLLQPDFVSALDGNEWNLLWAYERDYKVRQVALYSSHGTWPEDYCTRAGTEASVGATGISATLTTAGAGVFDQLRTSARIPIVESYVYRTTIAAGCSATPILQVGTSVLGVMSTSTDGRERAALTFSSNQHLMQSHLLTYGLFRWASKGLYLGEQRHFLNVDVDDWFNSSDHLYTDGHIETDPGFSMSAHDAYNVYLQQLLLQLKYPLAMGFKFNMAYNGGDANLTARSACYPTGGTAQLTATTRCLRSQFNWINHTLTHPEMNSTSYATSLAEINNNLTVAAQLGLAVDRTVLKTGEYSGLGVYNPNPDDDLNPPTDFGLMASNGEFLRAAKDAGVKYLHGNMSFASHQPACFNCAITHPMQPELSIVPDWPTNIAYHVTNAAEETYFYNSFYGPNGKFPYWSTNLTYAQLLDYEAGIGLAHVATGSVYSHTLHISNLRDYGSGRTLATDWTNAVMSKYSALYRVPLRSLAWPTLAKYSVDRNKHFAGVSGGVRAVYNRTTNQVTVSSPVATTVTVSGARTAGYATYGNEVSAPITLAAGASITFTPALRS
jgi:hypothetical protein